MKNRRTLFRGLMLVLLVAGVVGCGDGHVADGDGVVYLTPWNHDQIGAERLEDRAPSVAPEPYRHQNDRSFDEGLEQYGIVVEDFLEQPDYTLQRPDVVDYLGPIERSFIFSGRYLELAAVYQQHYRRNGIDSVAAPGLAWTYAKLGNQPGAEVLIEEMLEDRGDDPMTWAVVAKYYGRQAHSSQEAARQAKEAYQRLRELDPNFSFKTMRPERIQQELDALSRLVPGEDAGEAAQQPPDDDIPAHHVEEPEVDVELE